MSAESTEAAALAAAEAAVAALEAAELVALATAEAATVALKAASEAANAAEAAEAVYLNSTGRITIFISGHGKNWIMHHVQPNEHILEVLLSIARHLNCDFGDLILARNGFILLDNTLVSNGVEHGSYISLLIKNADSVLNGRINPSRNIRLYKNDGFPRPTRIHESFPELNDIEYTMVEDETSYTASHWLGE